MNISKSGQMLLYAVERGYTVKFGEGVRAPSGNPVVVMTGKSGYPFFTIQNRRKGLKGRVFLHRMVGYKKYGDKIFKRGIEVRHKDNDKQNYSDDNILIGTPSNNRYDLPPCLRLQFALRAAQARHRFTKQEVAAMRARRDGGERITDLAREYGISKGHMSQICSRKTIYRGVG